MDPLGKRLQGLGAWMSGDGVRYENMRIFEQDQKDRAEQARRTQQQRISEAEKQRLQTLTQQSTVALHSALKSGDKNLFESTLAKVGGAVAGTPLEAGLVEYQRMYAAGDVDGLRRELASDMLFAVGPQQSGDDWSYKVVDGQAVWTNNKTRESYAEAIPGMAKPPETPDFSLEDQRKYLQDVRKVISKAREDFSPVEANYQILKGSEKNPSAAGDLGMVIGYMKMLDPASVVREGEQIMVKNATGALAAPARLLQELQNGQTLTKEQRADILENARRAYQARAIIRDAAIFDQLTYAQDTHPSFDAAKVLGRYAGDSWDNKRLQGMAKDGSKVMFSLRDLYQTAREEGKSVSQVVRELGLDEGLYQ